LEPEIASAFESPIALELETYYSRQAVPGIRKRFFLAALWVVTVSSLAYLFASETSRPFVCVLIALASVYLIACFLVSWAFAK
ncbi:MAG: hypothetical protein ACRD3J_31700, partial [Thermoanaerobaculia bacterium]